MTVLWAAIRALRIKPHWRLKPTLDPRKHASCPYSESLPILSSHWAHSSLFLTIEYHLTLDTLYKSSKATLSYSFSRLTVSCITLWNGMTFLLPGPGYSISLSTVTKREAFWKTRPAFQRRAFCKRNVLVVFDFLFQAEWESTQWRQAVEEGPAQEESPDPMGREGWSLGTAMTWRSLAGRSWDYWGKCPWDWCAKWASLARNRVLWRKIPNQYQGGHLLAEKISKDRNVICVSLPQSSEKKVWGSPLLMGFLLKKNQCTQKQPVT